MSTTACFRMYGNSGIVTIEMPISLVEAVAAATVHRDEGPTVVTVKCESFEAAEALGQMLRDARQFIETSR